MGQQDQEEQLSGSKMRQGGRVLSEQPQQGGRRAVSDRTGRDRMAAFRMTGERREDTGSRAR